MSFDLATLGIDGPAIVRNASPARLYEDALRHEPGTALADSGALSARSGARTGRSPHDKRIAQHPAVAAEVWWGEINRPIAPTTQEALEERARDALAGAAKLYVVDGFAGWAPATACASASSASAPTTRCSCTTC